MVRRQISTSRLPKTTWGTARLQLREVRERPPAGTFGADFGNYDPVAFVNKALEDIFQLRRGVGAVQRPLIGQHRAGFERAQAGAQRGVVAVVQKIASYQVEFKGHSLLKANKRRTSSNIWYDSGDGKVSLNGGFVRQFT